MRMEQIHQNKKGLYIGDFVFGANDGIITTFAVISGAAGAALSPGIVIILGLANLVADGISMGLSNYLSLRSRLDFQKKQRATEEKEVDEFPEAEKKEVSFILKKLGVPEENLERAVGAITQDKKRWVDLMMKEELGIFENNIDMPTKHGGVMAASFILAGALPLLPYIFGVAADFQFTVSILATALTLFAVGAMRIFVTGANWFRSGTEMLFVGGLAAVAAYGVGAFVKIIFGLAI